MSADNQSPGTPPVGPRTVTYRQPASSGSRWLIGCLAIAVGGMALVMLLGVLLVGGIFARVLGGAEVAAERGPEAAIREVTVSGHAGEPKVAVIPVSGVLMPGDGGLGSDPQSLFEVMLKKARRDEDVKAVILAIDSGGGAITTSDIMYNDLAKFREDTKKPVVVLMGDITASGAYYLSCAADHLMAHPTTITGSIGVMMPLFSVNDLLKKVGVADQTIATGPYKEIGSPWGRTPEQWEKDKELLSGIMGQMYDRFVGVVAKGRGLDDDVVRKLADGRIYSAQQALDNKLIDSIGYMSDAEKEAMKLGHMGSAHVVEYGRTPSLAQMLFGASAKPELTVKLDAAGAAGPAAEGRPMYLLAALTSLSLDRPARRPRTTSNEQRTTPFRCPSCSKSTTHSAATCRNSSRSARASPASTSAGPPSTATATSAMPRATSASTSSCVTCATSACTSATCRTSPTSAT